MKTYTKEQIQIAEEIFNDWHKLDGVSFGTYISKLLSQPSPSSESIPLKEGFIIADIEVIVRRETNCSPEISEETAKEIFKRFPFYLSSQPPNIDWEEVEKKFVNDEQFRYTPDHQELFDWLKQTYPTSSQPKSEVTDEEIEAEATEYADVENSAWVNDFHGFIAGANFVRSLPSQPTKKMSEDEDLNTRI